MAIDTALIFNIIAKDHTRKTFDRVGLAAKAAFAAAGFGVAMFAKQSIAAYADAEKQQSRLEGAYKRFPKVADVSIDALRDMNSALQQTTRFDDDAVAGAQALLAQFNLTGQQIKKVTPLLLDYAAATGKDVGDAAESLGKAFLGQTRALKEVGISYKTTGDAGQDFANITDLLAEKVGGFAEEEGKTAAGQMAILTNKFGDLQESVGQALIPALTALVDVATPVLDAFNKLPEPMQTTAVVATGLGVAALVAVPKIIAFKAAIESWGPAGAKAKTGLKGLGAAALATGALLFTEVGGAESRVFRPITRTTAAVRDQKSAVDALKDSWDLLSGLLDKRAAKRNWIDSMSEVSAKIKEAGGKFDESTGKGRDFQDWLDTTVGNLQNYAQGFKNPLQQQKVMNDGLDDIKENLKKQGLSDAQVNKIMGGFDKIKNKVVDLQTTAAKPVTLKITPKLVGDGTIVVQAKNGGRALLDVDYREGGGPVKAGRPYVVGEKRPELFVPKTDGTILPSVPAPGGGGLVVNIEHLHTDGDRLEESLPRAVRRTAFLLGMGAA